MSRIYFVSPGGEASLRGSERAYASFMVADITAAAFSPTGYDDDPLFTVTRFSKERYSDVGAAVRFVDDFRRFLRVSSGERFTVPGGSPDVFSVCLNTALAVGGDAVCLLARLHGQCEIHAWVDGPNRAWLAGIIDTGRKTGVLRPDQGWEDVATFLRQSESDPVVTWYSVTDSFPNPHVAGWTPQEEVEDDWDGWYDLPDAEKWALCMRALRAGEGAFSGLEMRPDLWRMPDFWFGRGDTAFTVLEAARRARMPGDTP